jgi:hypothetical protein
LKEGRRAKLGGAVSLEPSTATTMLERAGDINEFLECRGEELSTEDHDELEEHSQKKEQRKVQLTAIPVRTPTVKSVLETIALINK